MTVRPGRSDAGGTTTQPYDDTTKMSASRGTRSTRSASAVLDDLTESSIAPEDAQRDQQDTQSDQVGAQQQLDGRDFVVYDAPSSSQNNSPALSQGGSAAGDVIDWRQRRAQRRQLVHVDESAVDDDESAVQPDTLASSQPTGTVATRAESVADTEETATAYSSPAAARLARQAATAPDSATSTPTRPLPTAYATPKQPSASASEERAKMKQYLLNSVKATDRTRSRNGRSSDAHAEAIERLKAQAQLHRTPGSLSEGDANGSPATSADPTPRRRMDRLGKANTFAAGRTPLPKGGVAELLRRGALFGVSDSSGVSSAVPESPLRAAPEAKDDEAASSTGTYSEASSNDLALAPNSSKHGALGLRANTSFPGLGAADAGTEANSFARPRVDAAKLALYQSKLNARLDAENEELKRERDGLLQKLAKLEAGERGQPAQPELEAVQQELKSEKERADALDKEAQELADLLDEKERELESLKAAPEGGEEHEQLREEIEDLQRLLKERDEDLEELEGRLERERMQMEEQVQQAKAFSFQTLDKIETERDQALERVEELQAELARRAEPSQVDSALQQRIEQLEGERNDLAKQLETIQQTASKMETLQNQAKSDAARIRGLERRLNAATAQLAKTGQDANETQDLEVEALKEELRQAQLHVADLETRATSTSVQEERILFLERQKSDLEKRVEQYREQISMGVGSNLANLSNGDGTSFPPTTPARAGVGSSPLPKSVMSLRSRNVSGLKTPRSPGPLSDASWLYNEPSSLGAAGVVERIAYLESALDEANASIDAKLQQLDSAGLAHLTLAERLERANERISELEAELLALRSLNSHPGDSSTASNKSVSQRQKVFADVHAQLEGLKARWAADHDKLEAREREVERREREHRQIEEVLGELERFKEATKSLERDLQEEREKQRSMLAQTRAAGEQKEAIESSLSRTQAELDSVKRRLGGSQDQVEVEALKQERQELLTQRAQLHSDFASANENYNRVLSELATSKSALAEHQGQLDEQIRQMEAAHAALRSKKAAYERVVGDRDRLRAERDLIVHDVGMFEQELRKVRREADRQGQDLEVLRAERKVKDQERAEFMLQVKTLVDQLRSKTNEVESIKRKLDGLERSRLAPPPYMEEGAVKKHEAECKGLLLQIRYLNLKLRREMDLRADLSHQKQYVSLLLQGYTQSDKELGKLIFELNLQHPSREARRKRDEVRARWSKVLNAVGAVARMKGLARKVGEVREIKKGLMKAHEEVKSRRNAAQQDEGGKALGRR